MSRADTVCRSFVVCNRHLIRIVRGGGEAAGPFALSVLQAKRKEATGEESFVTVEEWKSPYLSDFQAKFRELQLYYRKRGKNWIFVDRIPYDARYYCIFREWVSKRHRGTVNVAWALVRWRRACEAKDAADEAKAAARRGYGCCFAPPPGREGKSPGLSPNLQP